MNKAKCKLILLKEENDFYKHLTDQYKGMYEREKEKTN